MSAPVPGLLKKDSAIAEVLVANPTTEGEAWKIFQKCHAIIKDLLIRKEKEIERSEQKLARRCITRNHLTQLEQGIALVLNKIEEIKKHFPCVQ